MLKKFIIAISIVLALVACLGLGFFIGQESIPSRDLIKGLINKELGMPQDLDFSLFWDTWDIIEKKYAGRLELNRQGMIYGAISGMVKSLDDPYSVFMDPEDSHRFLEDIKGSFEGIGAEIGIRNGVLTVIAPLEGTPAKRAGLKARDKIMKIDDTLTAELTLDRAVNLIRGPKGTKVVLIIIRADQTKEIEITRGIIDIPEVRWELKEGDIAYVDIFHFSEEVSREFTKVAVEVLASNARGIILDLRNNPGGYLERAVDMAGWFLEKGEIVVIEDFGNDNKKEYRTHGNARLKDFPLVVLINQGSASASEILAGALRDNKQVLLVGMKIILLKEVKKLGKAGDIKEVADGYARNFLIPRGLVVFASQNRLLELKRKLEAEAKKAQTELKKLKELVKKLAGLKLEISSKARKSGKLFGSITPLKITKLLQKEGLEIKKDQIALKEPIKEVGKYPIKINLDQETEAKITIIVKEKKIKKNK